MPLFHYDDSDVDMELVREDRERCCRSRRMFAWCSECMSNGHRPGCPEATDEDDEQGEEA
jgi:hypothetical protein